MLWALLLLLIAVVIVVLELFVPSAGMLAFLATGAVMAAIVVGFLNGLESGLIVVGVAVVALPTVIALLVRIWPHTPLGRRILIQRPLAHEILPDTEDDQALRRTVGRRGRAKSAMLPSGAVVIDGRTYDAISEADPIEPDAPVLVIGLRNNRIVVRPLDEREPEHPAATTSASESDLLNRPIEDLGLDPFGDPLA